MRLAGNQNDDDDHDDSGEEDDDDGDGDIVSADGHPRNQHFLPKRRVAYNHAGFKAPQAVLRFLTPGPSKIFLMQPLSWVKIFRNGSSGVNIFLQGPSGGQNILAGPIVGQVFLQGLTQVKYSHSQISCALSTVSAISLEYMEPHKYSPSTQFWTT